MLCAFDREARRLTPSQADLLRDLAAIAADQLETHLQGHQLRESEARLHAAIESLPFDFWICDRDGRCVVQNATAVRNWGDTRGCLLEDVAVDAETAASWLAVNRRVLAGDTVHDTMRQVTAAGERELECVLAPVRSDGDLLGPVGLNVDVTARREAERRLADFLATASDWLWETDARHEFVWLSDKGDGSMFAPGAALGRTHWQLAGADPEEDPLWRAHRADLEAHRPFRDLACTFRAADGGTLHFEISGSPIFAADGSFRGYRGTRRDVTARVRAEAERNELHQHFSALMASGVVGIITGEAGRILEANDEFLRLTGYDRSHLHATGISWRDFTPPEWAEADERALAELNVAGVCRPFEKEYFRKDGSRVPVLLSAVLIDRTRTRWICLVQDISERKQAEAEIRQLAFHDSLTGLPNRRRFNAALETLAERLAASSDGGALLLVDLDHFKDVNDSLGHDAGDELLREMAARFRRASRKDDMVARLGGDEFAVIACGPIDAPAAAGIARKLLEEAGRLFPHRGRSIQPGVSIGVALFPRDGKDCVALLKAADLALYRAKEAGRHTVRCFEPWMRAEHEGRLARAAELQRGLSHGEFRLVYQPLASLGKLEHVGFEALVRWQHPSMGLLSPAAFLEGAEKAGLIVPLGRHVLRTALAQVRAWLDDGLEPGQIAVNVAAAQLKAERFAEEVAGWLAESRLEPRRLKVEITENVLLDESGEQVPTTLRQLHRLGVAIALDDFGTGFASLAHLKQFPVDTLKVDRSFVRDIGTDADDGTIVRTVINLAHSLGMTVVAEGIETEEQMAYLRLHACDQGQGYLLARPTGPDDARRHLEGRASGGSLVWSGGEPATSVAGVGQPFLVAGHGSRRPAGGKTSVRERSR